MAEKREFISAIVVAAGKGTRMNMNINKQYIELQGIPVLVRTLKVFQDSPDIDEIVMVVNEKEISYCQENIVASYEFDKVKRIVAGGAERQNSVYNGLKSINPQCDIVLIHDGARPFVSGKCLKDSIDGAREFGASCAAVPVKDTIKRADNKEFVLETIERSSLWSIQTPQTFRYDVIMDAHRKALEEGYLGTDDAVLVERAGVRTKLVMGSYNNIKITTKEDLAIAEAILGNIEA